MRKKSAAATKLTSTARTVLLTVAGFLLLIQSKPYLSPYFTNQGLQLVEKKRFNEAMFFLNVAQFLHPEEYRVLNGLGRIYYQKKLYPLAIDKLKRAVQFNPQLTEAYLLLSKSYVEIGQYEMALNVLRAANQFAPADKGLTRLMEDIKKEYITEQINKATELYSQNNIEETRETLKKASELSDATFYSLFSVEYVSPAQEESLKEQIDKLEILSKVENQSFATYQLVANALMEARDFKKAAEYYKKCLNEKPNSVALHNNLAIAFFEAGQFENAIKEYRIALSFEPDNNYVIYGLARSYEETGLLEEAKNLYLFLQKFSAEMPYIHLGLAKLHKKAGNAEEAKKELEKAVELSEKKLTADQENIVAQSTLREAKIKLQ